MKYLKQLNIVPALSPAPRSPRKKRSRQDLRSEATSGLTYRFTVGSESLESRVFDDGLLVTDSDEAEDAATDNRDQYFLKSPPDCPPSVLFDCMEGLHEAPGCEHSTQVTRRPLPEAPSFQPRPPSASSLRSNCPSLTPSLRQYVESDDFDHEEIRLSTAQPLLIPSESMQALELAAGAVENTSISDYATSQSSTEASLSPTLPSPAGYIATTGSVLERHLTQFDSPARSSPSRVQSIPYPNTDSPLNKNVTEPRTGVLNLSEAEWLRHTPSPLQHEGKQGESLWRSRNEAKSAGSSVEEVVRLSDGDHQSYALTMYTMQEIPDTDDQAPIGNWI